MKSVFLSVLFCFFSLSAAQAAVTMRFVESGTDVVGTLSGTLDLPTVQGGGSEILYRVLAPNYAVVATGLGTYPVYRYDVSGPTSFGTGSVSEPTANTTNVAFKLIGGDDGWFATYGVISPAFVLSGALTFANQTLLSLGLLGGSYVYKFDNGETFTVEVAAVPIPAGLALMGAVLAGLGVLAWRRQSIAIRLAEGCLVRLETRPGSKAIG